MPARMASADGGSRGARRRFMPALARLWEKHRAQVEKGHERINLILQLEER